MTKQSNEMLYSGLTKIGEATWNGEGILFITGGTNMTVTKYIGEAFKTKHLLSGTDWNQSATPIIGVVPWNTIQRNDQLICTDGKWPIKYGQIIGQAITGDREEIHDKYKEMLDSNHTNFLFVDINADNNNAATVDFRFILEKIIRESLEGKFILMVLQGGLETIKFIDEATQNQEDILLIKGYGGIADIISSALNLTQVDDKKRKELVQSAIEQDDYLLRNALTEEESIRTVEHIEIILQNKELLTVFDLGSCDQAEDFGMILENIIHGGQNTKSKQETTGEEKMKRAIRSGDTKLVSELLQSGKYTECYQDFIHQIFLRDKYECLNVFFEIGINTRQLLDFEIWQRYFLENKAVVPKAKSNLRH
ncbi:transient receptor potential cation channel subfamily M member 2-like [Patella vulgata]|uniref:transient receptor potential cation channel subfamily M member 2-like n=1 Tax=Patella vulgata TaxID=6465 RepID=UPI0024A915A8|nr:transient receptor potential cation channel subfamily M member 2-like [Patella vulgata]